MARSIRKGFLGPDHRMERLEPNGDQALMSRWASCGCCLRPRCMPIKAVDSIR